MARWKAGATRTGRRSTGPDILRYSGKILKINRIALPLIRTANIPLTTLTLTAPVPTIVAAPDVYVPLVTLALSAQVPSLSPAPPINVAAITYSQSSVYTSNDAATNAGMTNGVFTESMQTGTDNGIGEWVQMDLGGSYTVANVYVGSATASLAGGWDSSYSENLKIEHSLDGSSWTDSGLTTGTFAVEEIKTIAVSFTARYIRLITTSATWIAITEFYATST